VCSFYARHPARSLCPGRNEVHADFGPSSLGRNSYRQPLSGRQKVWETSREEGRLSPAGAASAGFDQSRRRAKL
jgi:hypothetical protein